MWVLNTKTLYRHSQSEKKNYYYYFVCPLKRKMCSMTMNWLAVSTRWMSSFSGFSYKKMYMQKYFASWIIIKAIIIVVRQLYGWGLKYCSSKLKPYLPPTIAASLIPLDSGPANLTRKAASGANGAANLGLLVWNSRKDKCWYPWQPL